MSTSLNGTMVTPPDPQEELLKQLRAAAQQAQAGAGQAQGQYQQAAAQPPPELDLASMFIPTLLGNIASTIAQDPSYKQHAQNKIGEQRKALLEARSQHLQALRDTYSEQAKAADAAGDMEAKQKALMAHEKAANAEAIVLQNLQHSNAMELEGLRSANRAPAEARQEARATRQDKQLQLQTTNMMVDNINKDPDIKDFITVRDNYRRVLEGAKSKSGIGDLAVIFAYMRTLDPTSVVRESEYKNAAQAIGKLPILANTPKSWWKGDKLTPQGRAGFIAETRQLYATKKQAHDRAIESFRGQAESLGIDPKLVLRDYSAPAETVNMAAPDGLSDEDAYKEYLQIARGGKK